MFKDSNKIYIILIWVILFSIIFISGFAFKKFYPSKTMTEAITFEPEIGQGSYLDYNVDLIANSDTDDYLLLFFKTSWCSTCTGLDNYLEINKQEIPGNLKIFKIDFDTNLDLKKQYGVTIQHTLVQINNEGQEIARWTGSRNLQELLEMLK